LFTKCLLDAEAYDDILSGSDNGLVGSCLISTVALAR
jgi:hypothetical protein